MSILPNPKFPISSSSNYRDGNWFIYQDEDDLFQIWSSSISGKEKVYYNNELVSEKRSFKELSEHSFKGKNDVNYKAVFERQRFIASFVVCRLYKEDIRIRSFSVYFENKENKQEKSSDGFLSAFVDGMIGEVIFEAVVGIFLFIVSHLALDYIIDYLETSTNFSDVLGVLLLLLLLLLFIYFITGRREYFVREELLAKI